MNTNNQTSFIRSYGRRALALAALVALVTTLTLILADGRTARAEPDNAIDAQVATQPLAQARPFWNPQRAQAQAQAPVITTAAVVAEAPAPAKATRKAAGELRGVVNINTADEKQLRLLPGVGATKARRVLAHREERGPFARVVDLRKVKGFGKKTVEKLAPYLSVNGPTTLERK